MATIYSITSTKGNKVYIGSTTTTLAQREASHKTNNNCTSKILFQEYGIENCIFTILEECSVEQRYEREKYYMDNTPNIVNKIPPSGYGMRPWTESQKEKRFQKQIEYREANRDKHYYKNWDKYKEYREANKDKLHEYDKKYREENRERELQRKRDWYYANKAKKESATL